MGNPNLNETTPAGQNEGEGNRTAARRYNAGVEKTVESGRVDELAKAAEEALEGDEGAELRAAEKEAKEKGEADDDERPTLRNGESEPPKS